MHKISSLITPCIAMLASGVQSSGFTLELLHAADQEAGAAAVVDAPNFSAVLNALQAQDLGNDGQPDNTIVLSSGDAIIPGLFYDASGPVFGSAGIADIQIQNELGFQAIALGNHEFDFGTAELAGLIDGSAPGAILGADFAGANFPYLSTNLNFGTDANTAPLVVANGLAPQPNVVGGSTVITVNGELIGVIGATTPTLEVISNPGSVGISPLSFGGTPSAAELDALAAIIQAEVNSLLGANPSMDKVILLAHMQQLSIELALAERLINVDIIVAGGSNTRLFDSNDRPRAGDSDQGEYPQFVTNAGGTTTAVVNTDGSYKYVGRLVIDFDGAGNIIPGSYDPLVSGAYATDAQGVTDLGAAGLVDPEIQQIADLIEAQILATEGNVFGVSTVFLNGNRSGTFDIADPDGVRTQETNLGNLTADANLAYAKSVDPTVVVSLKNGGGIRSSIGRTVVPPGGTGAERLPNEPVSDSEGNIVKPEGGISQNDIQTTLAFNNGLTLLTVTKAELIALLEHGIGQLPGVGGRFPQVAGVQFSFDETLPEGDRIASAALVDEAGYTTQVLVEDGEFVGDPQETFRIVSLNFLASGGDGYPFPSETDPAANFVQLAQGVFSGTANFAEDGSEQDALAEYLAANFNASNPYCEADTGPGIDDRIQNLSYRSDTALWPPVVDPSEPILSLLATYQDPNPAFDEGAAEIVSFDAGSQKLFAVNADAGTVDILSLADPALPTKVGEIDVSTLTNDPNVSAGPNSVAVANGLVAVAVEFEYKDPITGDEDQIEGRIALYDTDGNLEDVVMAGFLPDMVTFDPKGKYALVGNEGEPGDSTDPEGSVTIYNVRNGKTKQVSFAGLNGQRNELIAAGVRILNPAATVAQDLEPEYIAVNSNGTVAYVACQEANCIVVINIRNGKILGVEPLGFKDWSQIPTGFDASDRDDSINLQPWPALGMYQPDAIDYVEVDGRKFIITAGEGDARDDFATGDGEERFKDFDLDPSVFPNADWQDDEALGRLEISRVNSGVDANGVGLLDTIWTYGSRSFSLFEISKNSKSITGLAYDSGSEIELITAALLPAEFNSNNDENQSFDSRSDAKGPEPEAVDTGVVNGQTYAFIGLERIGGVMVYNISNPDAPQFVQYINKRDFKVENVEDNLAAAGDLGPECVLFIPADQSPNGKNLLVVSNEISGSISTFLFE